MGGILVLIVFSVMLTNKVVNVDIRTGTLQTLPASIVVAMTAGILCGVFYLTDWNIVRENKAAATTVYDLGNMFMTTYLLPFEVASIVLLVALVGAATIARRDKKSVYISSKP